MAKVFAHTMPSKCWLDARHHDCEGEAMLAEDYTHVNRRASYRRLRDHNTTHTYYNIIVHNNRGGGNSEWSSDVPWLTAA